MLKARILDFLKLTSYHKRRRKHNIGEHSYICHGTKIAKTAIIGKYCSIADNVCIGFGSHPLNLLSTSPFLYNKRHIYQVGYMGMDEKNLITCKRTKRPNTIIENDVYVGYGAIILGGVKVGNGAVIGAGAVVTKDVEPYSIVAGVPAKLIKYRFNEDQRQRLLELKWWDLPEKFIVKLPFENIDECLDKIEEYRQQEGIKDE